MIIRQIPRALSTRDAANKMLDFNKRGKTSWGRAGNQQIQPKRNVEYGIEPGHIGGRRAVSPTHFPDDFECPCEEKTFSKRPRRLRKAVQQVKSAVF